MSNHKGGILSRSLIIFCLLLTQNFLSTRYKKSKTELTKLNLISYIKFFLEKIFGNKIHNIFLSVYRGRYVSKQRMEKQFSANLIKLYISSDVKITTKKFFFLLS